MLITKSKLHTLLLIAGLFCFASCDKDALLETDLTFEVNTLTIATETCFSPTSTTLILGQLDEDNLFSEIDDHKHHIDWYKDGELFRSSTNRLDCAGSGEYLVKVIFRELQITKELEYTLSLESPY